MFQFTNSLDSLMFQKKGKSRCINQENPRGEKGKGGMAAGSLGPGRKGSPCMEKIAPGETRVLAENTVTETDARKALALLKLKMRRWEESGRK